MNENLKNTIKSSSVILISFISIIILTSWLYFLCHLPDKNSCPVIDTFESWHDNGLKGIVNGIWYGSNGKR